MIFWLNTGHRLCDGVFPTENRTGSQLLSLGGLPCPSQPFLLRLIHRLPARHHMAVDDFADERIGKPAAGSGAIFVPQADRVPVKSENTSRKRQKSFTGT